MRLRGYQRTRDAYAQAEAIKDVKQRQVAYARFQDADGKLTPLVEELLLNRHRVSMERRAAQAKAPPRKKRPLKNKR